MVSILDEAMTETPEYTFRRIEPALYDDLRYISKSAFGFDPGAGYYRLKNETSAFGEPFLGYIAYSHEGEPAAFYGVYAHPVEYKTKTYVAAQSGDTMTHRSHTGKGLFTRLAKLTYALAKDHGVLFIYGFPNKNSYPGFVNKLSWICPANLLEYSQKVMTIPLSKIARKFTFLTPVYKAYVNMILSFYRTDRMLSVNSVIDDDDDDAGLSRSEQFIKYKSYSGCKMIQVDEAVVWIKVDAVFQIGDMERRVTGNFYTFNRKLRRLAFLLGADTITFLVTPGTVWDKVLPEFFKVKESLAYGYLDLSGNFPLDKLRFTGADSDTF
jgi:hypothetical protein